MPLKWIVEKTPEGAVRTAAHLAAVDECGDAVTACGVVFDWQEISKEVFVEDCIPCPECAVKTVGEIWYDQEMNGFPKCF